MVDEDNGDDEAVNSPVVGNLVTQSVPDIAIQEIVAQISRGSLHPFDGNGSLGDVEVVLEKLLRVGGRLPVELLGHAGPELRRIVQGLLVELLVLLEAGYVRILADGRIRIVY